MINREEYQFLVEIDKGLNMVSVQGQGAVVLGKCIESLERFLEIKKNEILQYEQMIAQAQVEEQQIPVKEE